MDWEAVGRLIRERRRERGLTQEEVAKKAGITRQTLSKIEAGRTALVSMASFARVLEVLELECELKPKRERKRLWTPEELLE